MNEPDRSDRHQGPPEPSPKPPPIPDSHRPPFPITPTATRLQPSTFLATPVILPSKRSPEDPEHPGEEAALALPQALQFAAVEPDPVAT